MSSIVPLATCADQILARLSAATGSAAIAKLSGTTLLCERAMLSNFRIPGRVSAGGGCRMFAAIGDTVALNLSRPTDRELLFALLETGDFDISDDEAIAARIAHIDAGRLLEQGRSLGLAIGLEHETRSSRGCCSVALPMASSAILRDACEEIVTGAQVMRRAGNPPRVLDLSALWAGPLAAHLLLLAGAQVLKVESRSRPDAMRDGTNEFFALLNQGKASVALDLREARDRQSLLTLIASSDIVIEAARPRALAQLGIDVEQLVRASPGLVWITITGHGATGEAANWIGFGDDCGVAGGLSRALRAASGRSGFVGDAIADPLTGISAALVAWDAWRAGHGGRFSLAMSGVVARCLEMARESDPDALSASLSAWSAAIGQPFPTVDRRPIGTVPAFGENTGVCLAEAARRERGRHQNRY